MSKTATTATKTSPTPPPPPPAPGAATTNAATSGLVFGKRTSAPTAVSRSGKSTPSYDFGKLALPVTNAKGEVEYDVFVEPVSGTGEAFKIAADKVANRISSAKRRYQVAHDPKKTRVFAVRKIEGEGVVVWRLADTTPTA